MAASVDDLIGRDAELSRLHDRLRDAEAGRGRVVLIGGDPGIGKSRLAAELARGAAARGIPVAWGRGVETAGAPAFWPWRQVLRDLAEHGDPEQIRAAAGEEGPTLTHLSVELGRLLGVAPAALPDAAEGRFQLFEAVTGFLCRSAGPRGLLIVIDDVQWADRPSVLLLHHLAGELPRARLLVVATHRDTVDDATSADVPAVLGRGHAESLRLDGLEAHASTRQLQAVLGTEVDPLTAARVHAITEGNPFFTAEMGRLLVGSGAAVPVGRAAALDVPRSVREVVRRRVVQLDADCRALLDAASVVGRDFSVEVLAVMTDRSVVGVLNSVEHARRARVVEAGTRPGELRFAHVLVRETLYTELMPARRQQLHARAADALEWLHAERLEPHLSAIARHRLAAAVSVEEALTASHWLCRAADEATERLAWEEGVRLYRAALDAAGERLDLDSRAGALLAVATGLARSGELRESLSWCAEASRCARQAGRPELAAAAALVFEGVSDPQWNAALVSLCDDALAELPAASGALRARVLAQRTAWRVLAGDRDGVEKASAAAVALAEESGDEAAVASALRARQVVHSGPDGVAERRRIAARLLDIGARTGDTAALLWGRLWQIDTEVEVGDLAAARRDVDALAVQVGARGNPVMQWHLRRLQSVLAQARGEYEAAIAVAAGARDIMVRAGHVQAAGMYEAVLNGAIAHQRGVDESRIPKVRSYAGTMSGPFAPMVRSSLINMLLWCGRVDEARAEFRLLPPPGAQTVPGAAELGYQAFRAQAAAELGECAEAASLYAWLLPYADRHIGAGGPEYRGAVELVLGVVARRCISLDAAVEHLRRALQEHRRCEAVPFVVETQCELAETLLAAGAPGARPEARALATDALDVARRLGMAPFVARAGALLDSLSRARDSSPLSRREEEIAALVSKGLTSKEIATALHLSERTAQNHVQHILDKLGFASRSQIAAWVASRDTAVR